MPIRYSAFASAAYAAFHSCSALRQSPLRSAFFAAATWALASAYAGVAAHTATAMETAANARMTSPLAATRPKRRSAPRNPPGWGVVSSRTPLGRTTDTSWPGGRRSTSIQVVRFREPHRRGDGTVSGGEDLHDRADDDRRKTKVL